MNAHNSNFSLTMPLPELHPNPEAGSNDEALVLAVFTDLLNLEPDGLRVKEMREQYGKHARLKRMMDAVCLLQAELKQRERQRKPAQEE